MNRAGGNKDVASTEPSRQEHPPDNATGPFSRFSSTMNHPAKSPLLHFYRLFGTVVQSEIALPELADLSAEEAATSTAPVVQVRFGKTPETLPDVRVEWAWLQAGRNEALFSIADEFRIHVFDRNQIVIETLNAAILEKVGSYVMGCAFPTIAHLRGMVPLHVGMVMTGDGAIMIAGKSGAGKSTLTTALSQMPGNTLLCDDTCVFEQNEGRWTNTHFFSKHIKLWRDAIHSTQSEDKVKSKDYFRDEKFHLDMAKTGEIETSRISKFIALRWGESLITSPMSKVAIFREVMNSVYAPMLVAAFGNLEACQSLAQSLANAGSGIELIREKDKTAIEQVLELIKK
jgi:hypothetical protein